MAKLPSGGHLYKHSSLPPPYHLLLDLAETNIIDGCLLTLSTKGRTSSYNPCGAVRKSTRWELTFERATRKTCRVSQSRSPSLHADSSRSHYHYQIQASCPKQLSILPISMPACHDGVFRGRRRQRWTSRGIRKFHREILHLQEPANWSGNIHCGSIVGSVHLLDDDTAKAVSDKDDRSIFSTFFLPHNRIQSGQEFEARHTLLLFACGPVR
jgi:hypothetical protein